MISAQQRRETVQQLQARGISLRRSCALCHISRSSLRYRPRGLRRAQTAQLVDRLRQIAHTHPRYGYRRAHAIVVRDVAGVNVQARTSVVAPRAPERAVSTATQTQG
jgi:putative transposase